MSSHTDYLQSEINQGKCLVRCPACNVYTWRRLHGCAHESVLCSVRHTSASCGEGLVGRLLASSSASANVNKGLSGGAMRSGGCSIRPSTFAFRPLRCRLEGLRLLPLLALCPPALLRWLAVPRWLAALLLLLLLLLHCFTANGSPARLWLSRWLPAPPATLELTREELCPPPPVPLELTREEAWRLLLLSAAVGAPMLS